MCIAVYLSSPSPLPLVPWREENPGFYVDEVQGDDAVHSHFTWPNVYYAGSHEGCGCGFAYNQMPNHLQEPDDEVRRRASVAALRQYVTEATAVGPVQLYACWESEQALPEKDRLAASPDVLGGESFDFVQFRMLEFPGTRSRDRTAAGQQDRR
ncbi:hypothetical protein [Anaeromyxobacter terrae]|uniref:hypothetical protein n=1 Tax=Anaeromyxobacter terrae TaxID=2925406 RepID=UPI001F5837BF|nr:hypothetical protein [Anaeromyxobacter sp. SG22]